MLIDNIEEFSGGYALHSITHLAVLKDRSKIIALDGRYDAVLIISPVVFPDMTAKLKAIGPPSKLAKKALLLELGLVDEAEVPAIEKELADREDRKELLRGLMVEFESEFKAMARNELREEKVAAVLSMQNNREKILQALDHVSKRVEEEKGEEIREQERARIVEAFEKMAEETSNSEE